MKILYTATVCSVLATTALAETRSYDLTGFDAIAAHEGVEVVVTEGPEYSVTAEALRGDLDRLVIETDGAWLEISREVSFLGAGRRDRFVVTVALPDLTAARSTSGSEMRVTGEGGASLDLTASSGSRLSFEGSGGDAITLQASSGSNIDLEGIETKSIKAEGRSGSSIHISGSCYRIEAEASAGSAVRARDLACGKADIQASSGATVIATATETASARSKSGATAIVHGGAKAQTVRATGGSTADVR